jgi:predicted transcriptional regulator
MALSVKELPREILEKAVQLKNCQRNIFIALYTIGKPTSAQRIADFVGHKRAYVHMRLLQLAEKGLVKESLVKENRKGREKKLFEVVT